MCAGRVTAACTRFQDCVRECRGLLQGAEQSRSPAHLANRVELSSFDRRSGITLGRTPCARKHGGMTHLTGGRLLGVVNDLMWLQIRPLETLILCEVGRY